MVRFCLFLALSLPLNLLAAEHTTDTPEMVKKTVTANKAVLLDVREKSEWDAGHLRDAKLLPLSSLKNGFKPDDVVAIAPKGAVVYIHCRSGGRCLQAADILQKVGYDVRPLKQGYQDLLEAGFEPAPK